MAGVIVFLMLMVYSLFAWGAKPVNQEVHKPFKHMRHTTRRQCRITLRLELF